MIAYLDMFSGVSGDMIVGGLLDAGLDRARLEDSLRGLSIPPFALEARRVRRGALAATLAVWHFEDAEEHRHLPEIERLISGAGFADPVREGSLAVFRRLAGAEARVHGIPPAEVHFHEVGALDAILDVCGAVSALHLLGVERLEASAFRTGSGYVDTAHGRLPVPAPAVSYLIEGWRLDPLDANRELTTPTGAAIVTTLASAPGAAPSLIVRATGHGAGTRDVADPPNCLRVLLGDAAGREGGSQETGPGEAQGWVTDERLIVLETVLDDMNPQLYPWLEERLAGAGAREVSFTGLTMKRGRPGTLVRCLADGSHLDALAAVLFRETTTLGVRHWPVLRRSLERTEERVATSLGWVRVKRVLGPAGREEVRAEYEECRRLALEHALPLREVAARLALELAAAPRNASGDNLLQTSGGSRAAAPDVADATARP
ncbi:MAG: nickel pincer cofactor biosynthesis protein LarC [Gemmatimonadetes bacterium]|nr:nickel pincer cofactor biosynthesis protein LarC [Gemmatimonadota bacterium]